MREIGVITVARSDYGIYLPVLRKIKNAQDLRLYLIVAGMHLSPEYGMTVRMIESDGFRVDERIEMLLSSDTPEGIAKSIGLGVLGFAQVYARHRPDILLVLGDRYEMYAGALAALPFKIPLAHIHGGEVTEGAIDDAMRHSITKLSHLHFVSTKEYARRVVQLGEEPWRIVVSGAPSLDNMRSITLLTKSEIETQFGLRLQQPFMAVTMHPVTLEFEQLEWQVSELLDALDKSEMPVVFTMPNADTGSRTIVRMIADYVQNHELAQKIENLGTKGYFSMLNLADVMVGNSSSGIVEAALFKLPVVNIGNRQRGRVRNVNIIDVGYHRDEIIAGIRRARSPEFRNGLRNLENPYGDGHAADRIVKVLKKINLDDRLMIKKFMDYPIEC